MQASQPQPPSEKLPDGQQQSLAARALVRTTAKQRAFLTALETVGTVRAACALTRVGRRTIYDWISRDEQFADAFNLARDAAADLIEAEVWRRGVDGVPESVYYQGTVVGHVQKYSDACLLAILSAYRPERFGRRRAGKDSEPRAAIVHVTYDHNLKPTDAE